MLYYLMVAAAAVCTAASFVLNKYYQRAVTGLNNIECALRKSIPMGVATALFFLCLNGFRMRFSPFSLGMAGILAALNTASILVAFKAYEKGSISLFTMFQMQGGMLLPFIYGVAFADNALSVWRIAGICLMAISLCVPYLGRGKAAAESTEKTEKEATAEAVATERRPRAGVLFVVLCAVIFAVNGGISIVSYVHSNSALAVENNSFLVYYQLFSAVLAGIAYAVWCARHRTTNQFVCPPVRTRKRTAYLWGNLLASAILGAVGYLLQLIGAAHLPAVALYPMVTGGVVVLTAVAGLAFFRESLSVKGWLGIALTFCATILFMF